MTSQALKLVETTISETSVRMRLANDADPAKATEWVEFQVPLEGLMLDDKNPIGKPQARHLGLVQRAALDRARIAIDAETDRLSPQRRP